MTYRSTRRGGPHQCVMVRADHFSAESGKKRDALPGGDGGAPATVNVGIEDHEEIGHVAEVRIREKDDQPVTALTEDKTTTKPLP